MGILKGIIVAACFLFTLFWITGTFAVKEWKGKLFFGFMGIFNFLCGILLLSYPC
jgi:hypothetical protein